jgi:hypothetical protein
VSGFYYSGRSAADCLTAWYDITSRKETQRKRGREKDQVARE